MKVIFLDFDGVINSTTWLMKVDGHTSRDKVSEEMVQRVSRIVDETGAKVVVSSTWRKLHNLEELQEILDENGFTGEVIDRTEIESDVGVERGELIQKWLDQHTYVENFVVLDDVDEMSVIPDEKFIHTKTSEGLTDEQADRAIEVLSSE